jgi:hypothetical protein
MSECVYFLVTLEPHLKHSGAKTGRKIFFLVEVPRALARATGGGEPDDELALREAARRLASELAPVAMRGAPCAPGEDPMAVSCRLYQPHPDLLERVPDAVLNGARAWLMGTDLA